MNEMLRAQRLSGEPETNPREAVRTAPSAPLRERRGLRRYIGPKRAVGVAGLALIALGAWYLRRHGLFDPTLVQDFAQQYPVTAPILTVLAYALLVASGLPTLPINLAAGVFWGPVFGGLISSAGSTLGALAAFAAARSIFGRPLADRFDNKMISQIQLEFEKHGWRFVAFVRLNPIFPTGPLNYILGLTSIDTFTYVWATFAFLLPPSIAMAYIGYGAGTFLLEGDIAKSIKLLLAISAGVTILATLAYGAHLILLPKRNSRLPRGPALHDEQ